MVKQTNKRIVLISNHIIKTLLSAFLQSIAGFLLICNTAFAQSTERTLNVEGSAMEPSLNDGDTILISGEVEKLKRGDIIIFRFPKDPSKLFISRLIGLPGETIRMDQRGQLFINNHPTDEPYVPFDRNKYRRQISETYIKPHNYFVMGDNRDESHDSRSWGLVPERYIFGKFIRITNHATQRTALQKVLKVEKLIEVDSQNFAQEVMDSKVPVLIVIWAPWASPSRIILPTLESIAKEYNDRIRVCTLNLDENKDIIARFRIDALPTLILFQKGAEQERVVGTQSKDTIVKLVERQLNRSK